MVATQKNCLIPAGKQCNELWMLVSERSEVEACKQGMHSALSRRYKQVGSAFLTDSIDEEQDIDVL